MKITTKQLTFCAVLAAIYVVLATYLHIESNAINISVQSLPVLIGAITLGPVPAMFIAFVGELIKQVLMYGFDPTTLLWPLPYVVEGLAAGLIVKKELGNVSKKRIVVAIIVGEFILTLLVTPVNALAAVIQGWGTWAMILVGIPPRVLVMALRMVVYCLLMPKLYESLKKIV